MSIIDNIGPVKQLRIKQRTEPWIDSEILNAINQSDSAFKQYIKDRSVENYCTFKCLRNKTQYLIDSAKKSFFTETVEEKKSKSLQTILKNLGLPFKKGLSSSSSNVCLNIDGDICFDKETIADSSNTFYTTVPSKLVEKLPASVNKFGKYFVQMFMPIQVLF